MFRVFTCLLLVGLTLDVGTALAAGSQESIDGLTRQMMTLNAQSMTLNVQSQKGDATRARAQALAALVSIAAARQERLAALIADHPEVVLRHALSAPARATLPPTVQAYIEEEQAVEGELEVLHEDSAAGSRYLYSMRRGGERLALYFAADAPVLQTGDRVYAVGVRVRQSMAMSSGRSRLTVVSLAGSNTFGAQSTAVILVNFQDNPTQTWVTVSQAQGVVFGTGSAPSVTNFYREASYQQAWLAGDVYGIYTIAVNSTGCDTSSIATYAKQAATAAVGSAKMATYTRFVYAFPSNGCGWWGLGTVGGYPSQAWINGSFQNGVVAHEMGHNFGLWHSHGLECGTASIGSGCSSIEYGDTLDVMGSASPPKHFNAVQKELLGWLNYGTSPPVTTVQASGVYTLDPYESSAGQNAKALKVKTPSGDWYYVEYRQAIGFDTSTVSTNTNVTNGIVVHLWSQQDPNAIYLSDMTPLTSSWFDPALDLGNGFADPTVGITIAPVLIDSTKNTVSVNVTVGGGGPSCVRKNPTVIASPGQQQGTPGTLVSYTVSVTNNDSACAASSFTQQAGVPSGWTATLSSPTVNIAPGATVSTTLQVKSSTSALTGPYTISIAGSNQSAASGLGAASAVGTVYSGSAAATYNVAPPAGGGATSSFTDPFTRGDAPALGNGWTLVSGSWMIQTNEARTAPVRTMHTAVQAGLVGATQTVSARFASVNNSQALRFGLLVRYKDSGNYYMYHRQTGGGSFLFISQVVNGVETVLKTGAVQNPVPGVMFTLGCQVQGQGSGTTITLSYGGSSGLSVSDSTFSTGSVGMTMGYRVSGGSGGFSHRADDFTATVQ